MAQHTVAIIGVGTVGQSWAALFLSYGNRVRLWDPVERLDERFAAYLENVVTEKPLPPPSKLSSLWVVCKTVEEALEGVTYVQENAPENMETKQAMLRRIDEVLPTDVIVGSSTSSFLLVDMVATCTRAPSRVVLSHPFNRERNRPRESAPLLCSCNLANSLTQLSLSLCLAGRLDVAPHLMPLVELFGTSDGSVAKAIAFYKSVGRHPITMNKQLPGHVANRLTSAIFREAVWMLREGIASVADIDAAMSQVFESIALVHERTRALAVRLSATHSRCSAALF